MLHPNPTMTPRDLRSARDTWEELAIDQEEYDGPETIMLSFGYAEVYLDGDVVAFGMVVANVSKES